MSGTLNMGNNAIANVKTPANSTDAVNKEYVDNAVAGVKPSGDYLGSKADR